MRTVNTRNVCFFSLGEEIALLSQSPSFGLCENRPMLLLILFSFLHSLPVFFIFPSPTSCPTPQGLTTYTKTAAVVPSSLPYIPWFLSSWELFVFSSLAICLPGIR